MRQKTDANLLFRIILTNLVALQNNLECVLLHKSHSMAKVWVKYGLKLGEGDDNLARYLLQGALLLHISHLSPAVIRGLYPYWAVPSILSIHFLVLQKIQSLPWPLTQNLENLWKTILILFNSRYFYVDMSITTEIMAWT